MTSDAATPGQAARKAWGEHWAKAPERGRGKPGWDSLAYEAEAWEVAAAAAWAPERDRLSAALAERDAARAELARAIREQQECADERDAARGELDRAYRERAALVAYLAAVYPSAYAHDEESEGPGWNIIYAETPAGQMSWHVHPDDLDLFPHVPEGRPEWDGHTTGEKYRRLAELTARIARGDAP